MAEDTDFNDKIADDDLGSASADGGLSMDDMNGAAEIPDDAALAAHHSDDETVIGEADSGGVWHQQQTQFTCAVVSQEMVLHEFGIDTNEAQLMGEAMENGWLDVHGTPLADVGNLLELHGVPCHQGAGIEDLLQELSMGHKVIVGVDATELWNNSPIANELQDLIAQTPNHALVLQGIKQHDDGSWSVVVNDPGDPHGAGKEYPIDQFGDAWQDSHCFYVSTNDAPPDLADHDVFGRGFNEETGTYTGLMDWVHEHSSTLLHGAQAATLGFAGVGLATPSGAEKRTERERNDLLRGI